MRFCQIQSQEALGGAPDGVTLNSEGHDFLVKFSPPPKGFVVVCLFSFLKGNRRSKNI